MSWGVETPTHLRPGIHKRIHIRFSAMSGGRRSEPYLLRKNAFQISLTMKTIVLAPRLIANSPAVSA